MVSGSSVNEIDVWCISVLQAMKDAWLGNFGTNAEHTIEIALALVLG